MNLSKSLPVHGHSQLRLVQATESDDTKYHEEPAHGGGNDGGNGMDDLRKRVERTEENIAQIKVELAKLTTRSENFATKADLEPLKIEVAKLTMRSEEFATNSDLLTVKNDLQKELLSIHKEIANQTKWLAGTMLAVAGLSLAIARYLFG